MNEGWTCPKCGAVWAPWMNQCNPCNGFTIHPSFIPGLYPNYTNFMLPEFDPPLNNITRCADGVTDASF